MTWREWHASPLLIQTEFRPSSCYLTKLGLQASRLSRLALLRRHCSKCLPFHLAVSQRTKWTVRHTIVRISSLELALESHRDGVCYISTFYPLAIILSSPHAPAIKLASTGVGSHGVGERNLGHFISKS